MKKIVKGSFDLMKQINISAILNLIRKKSPISRTNIVEETGLAHGSVSKITRGLLNLGFVREIGIGQSSGGRPPVFLQLDPSVGDVIGVNLGLGYIEAVLMNLEAKIKVRSRIELKETNKEYVLENIEKIIFDIINRESEKGNIIGIGIAFHGIVDSSKGKSIFAPYYHFGNENIKEKFEKKFSLPVLVDNDVRAMAVGESWFGAAKGIENFISVNVTSGIGSGIVIGGELFTGVNYSAGEIGHILIDINGPKCTCGNNGCLEVYVSHDRIIKKYIELIKSGMDSKIPKNLDKIKIEDICKAANIGDESAIKVIKEASSYLGVGLVDVVNMFNPTKIILSGEIMLSREIVLEIVKKRIKSRALSRKAAEVIIEETGLGDNAASIGGATLIIKEFFKGKELFYDYFETKNEE